MGYRPTIYVNRRPKLELGKFYGYVNMDNLKSVKWLEDHGKIELDEMFAGYGPEIDFTADEFREFWDLYVQDINEYVWKEDDWIRYDEPFNPDYYPHAWKRGTFKENLYDTDDVKTIKWF